MSKEVTHEEALAEEARVSTKADIINGRIPVALVYQIRFNENDEDKDATLAKKYHTTPGKISDIRKRRNFKYIDETYRPTEDELAKAIEWADKMKERGDDVGADDLYEVLDSFEVATEEEAKAQAEERKASRKPRGATKKAKEADEAEAEAEPEAEPEAGELEEDISDLVD